MACCGACGGTDAETHPVQDLKEGTTEGKPWGWLDSGDNPEDIWIVEMTLKISGLWR